MKNLLLSPFDRIALRARKIILQGGSVQRWFDTFDVVEAANLKAAFESAEYYERHMLTAKTFRTDLEGLSHAITLAKPNGLFLEFGVATGRSINHISSLHDDAVYGFDSFEGLPEDWRGDHPKGKFAGPLPTVPAHVHLIKGWFSETLPSFLERHTGPVSFLHVDCDLYSSTKFIFDTLADRIQPECVIVFDEYFNYPGWREHEKKAFAEFIAKHGVRYRYESFVRRGQQVTVVIE
ncbi:class I SAM-dependent methyltransferase [Microvirga arabica]|uniref:class I SAM-dependent methyltransferase n=1 Tax=Microvirga arabica TaxID=1128671 RepID=UPI0019393331|nr:class I SAM-dependent methyltransferase [Microvirga arabica]MBM1173547.1 class I SAM-dependent methyltransferase [Microvirga arabica]